VPTTFEDLSEDAQGRVVGLVDTASGWSLEEPPCTDACELRRLGTDAVAGPVVTSRQDHRIAPMDGWTAVAAFDIPPYGWGGGPGFEVYVLEGP